MANEPLPADDLLTDLDGQWNTSNVAKPNLVVVTGNGEPLRFDLNAGDAVVARNTSFTETPIGNWTYGNRIYTVTLELWTLRERQRLFNIMQEIRRICHARMHSLTNFQRIQFMNFNEMTSDTVNVWMGSTQITLENSAVLLET